jgi:hypothetical protein
MRNGIYSNDNFILLSILKITRLNKNFIDIDLFPQYPFWENFDPYSWIFNLYFLTNWGEREKQWFEANTLRWIFFHRISRIIRIKEICSFFVEKGSIEIYIKKIMGALEHPIILKIPFEIHHQRILTKHFTLKNHQFKRWI